MVEGKIREWKGHSSGGAEVTEGGADQAKSRYEESTQATQGPTGLASRRRTCLEICGGGQSSDIARGGIGRMRACSCAA